MQGQLDGANDESDASQPLGEDLGAVGGACNALQSEQEPCVQHKAKLRRKRKTREIEVSYCPKTVFFLLYLHEHVSCIISDVPVPFACCGYLLVSVATVIEHGAKSCISIHMLLAGFLRALTFI